MGPSLHRHRHRRRRHRHFRHHRRRHRHFRHRRVPCTSPLPLLVPGCVCECLCACCGVMWIADSRVRRVAATGGMVRGHGGGSGDERVICSCWRQCGRYTLPCLACSSRSWTRSVQTKWNGHLPRHPGRMVLLARFTSLLTDANGLMLVLVAYGVLLVLSDCSCGWQGGTESARLPRWHSALACHRHAGQHV